MNCWILLLGFAATASAETEPPGVRDAIARHENELAAISRRLCNARIAAADSQSYKFAYALADLQGNGTLDAIVYFKDPGHCGSGGYNLEVYRGTEGGFEFVSGTVRVFGPIRALPEHPYGWATLIVNLRDEREVLLRYNGKAYPLAPPPKVKATKAQISAAKTVIE
jgi:hypothetical protein